MNLFRLEIHLYNYFSISIIIKVINFILIIIVNDSNILVILINFNLNVIYHYRPSYSSVN